LRREEVAWLAGVSPDHVKRLEQGRPHPSAGVLPAISRALRLSGAEYELARRQAGHAAGLDGLVPQHIGPTVQRLLDRLAGTLSRTTTRHHSPPICATSPPATQQTNSSPA
jgi:transcriptional regulator with XRE-family HTH domain